MEEADILKIMDSADISYAYKLAKELETIKSNDELGFRTAGSKAEFEAGELIKKRMEESGFSNVRKDEIDVDAWEFKKAVIKVEGVQDSCKASGEAGEQKLQQPEQKATPPYIIQLGAYQTDFVTDGEVETTIVNAGKGTKCDYERLAAAGVDVTGKLVLVEINQREEWWINFPVYQAKLKGALGLIAMQAGGYGEIDDNALNAQDIAGPCDAPAFSISRKDGKVLLDCMKASESGKECKIMFDAYTKVTKGAKTYNILGEIPGENPDRMIMLSAHYDSYFTGFQDDNTAVTMMIEIGRMLLKNNYKPKNTIVFCAMAAEEWGVENSKYDWSTGAYEEVFTVHPEWRGKVIADLNFELPAFAHGTKDYIRTTYEYRNFYRKILKEYPGDKHEAYPEGVGTKAPIETWSDDFSVAISGIPSTVNEFSGGGFMESHYHSQYDSDEFYDEKVYLFHHKLYAYVLLRLDETRVAPVDFAPLIKELKHRFDAKSYVDNAKHMPGKNVKGKCKQDVYDFGQTLDELKAASDMVADSIWIEDETREKMFLEAFAYAQDNLVNLSWQDDVIFPYETAQNNVVFLGKAIAALEKGTIDGQKEALMWLYRIDNNQYAFRFEKKVYQYFTEYVFEQPRTRLKWGYGRIRHHENLYDVVRSLLDKKEKGDTDVLMEMAALKAARTRQAAYLKEDMKDVIKHIKKMVEILE